MNQEELKFQVNYDCLTGIFRWNIYKRGTAKGSICGTYVRNNYIKIEINKKSYLAHRLAWLYVYGELPSQTIDHINGVTSDNRISNLRLASISQNKCNSSISIKNTSGYKGISFDKIRGTWIAVCRANGKSNFLGRYNTPELASEAYKKFAKEHHGEFYRE